MMIDKSQLDPIVKIRMDDSSKSILQSKLTAMVQNATLDAGAALFNFFLHPKCTSN